MSDMQALAAKRREDKKWIQTLDGEVRDRLGTGTAMDGGFARTVSWVSANLVRDLRTIDPEDVPSCDALGLLIWARTNQNEYRKSYDCRRVPAKGFATDSVSGFIDDGGPIKDILLALGELTDDTLRTVSKEDEGCEHDPEGGRGSSDSELRELPGPPAPRGKGIYPNGEPSDLGPDGPEPAGLHSEAEKVGAAEERSST